MNAQDETAEPPGPPPPAVGDAVGAAVLAERLRGLAPSCGPVRLVGIDGHAGSGKSTLARALAAALGGAPVLHLDDFASHERFFGWTECFAAHVLAPFARGEPAVFRPYDWDARRPGRTRTVAAAPVVLVEGVGVGRRALRPSLSLLWWMDLAGEAAWERGRERDGSGLADFWDDWERAEAAHFRADPSRPFADALVRQCGEGYVLRE